MTDETTQPVTMDQLAQLYQARNLANSNLAKAMRSKDKARITEARAAASQLNIAYVRLFRRFKRQQKAENRGARRTAMIRFYIDHKEAHA